MTDRQRVAAAAGAALVAGVVTLLLTRTGSWYAWLIVIVAALGVGYLTLARPSGPQRQSIAEPPVEPAQPPAEPAPEPPPAGEEAGEETGKEANDERASFAMRVTGLSHVTAVCLPSTTVGPEPLKIPLSGYNLYLELVVLNSSPVVLHGLRAEVTARSEVKFDGVSVVAQPGPALVLADDLGEARRQSLENYQPMEIPHFEILLDAEPPIVRPALDTTGQHARPCQSFPLLLQPEVHLRLVLAPITADRGRVDWRLLADVECDGERQSPSWGLTVTANTTFRTFHPGGREPELTPVHEIAPHWHVKKRS